MPSRDLIDVTLVSEDHEGLGEHNDSNDLVYHGDHDDCYEDEDDEDEDDEDADDGDDDEDVTGVWMI